LSARGVHRTGPRRNSAGSCSTPRPKAKGIATEAARSSLHHAFEVLGWATAVSYIAPGNDRSVRLAEKLGALRDRDAKGPTPETLVYRHPNPAEVAA